MTPLLTAFVVDDEPLARKRLIRLLEATARVKVAGSAGDPDAALAFLRDHQVDVLFLDIHMPVMTGFDLLARLPAPPRVVFTTAYDRYALQAFEVNSVDYLLKPIEAARLAATLDRLERLRGEVSPPALGTVLDQLAGALAARQPPFPDRLATRVGERVQFVDLARVTHFFAKDKLTFAASAGRQDVIDATIAELETRLDPRRFFRIHRATVVSLAWVDEVHGWFGGRLLVRLRDDKRTELEVARDRVRALKDRLGF